MQEDVLGLGTVPAGLRPAPLMVTVRRVEGVVVAGGMEVAVMAVVEEAMEGVVWQEAMEVAVMVLLAEAMGVVVWQEAMEVAVAPGAIVSEEEITIQEAVPGDQTPAIQEAEIK